MAVHRAGLLLRSVHPALPLFGAERRCRRLLGHGAERRGPFVPSGADPVRKEKSPAVPPCDGGSLRRGRRGGGADLPRPPHRPSPRHRQLRLHGL